MVEIFIVLRIFPVVNIIVYLLVHRAVLSLLHKLVIRHGSQEYLPVRLAESYHKGVYFDPVPYKRCRIVQLFFIHKQGERILLHKVDSRPLVLIDVTQTTVSALLQVVIYRLVLRIAVNVYLQSFEYVLFGVLSFAFRHVFPYLMHERVAQIHILFLRAFVYYYDIVAIFSFYVGKYRRNAIFRLARHIAYFSDVKFLFFFCSQFVHYQLRPAFVAGVKLSALLAPPEYKQFILFAMSDVCGVGASPYALPRNGRYKQQRVECNQNKAVVHRSRIKYAVAHQLRNAVRTVFQYNQINALVYRGKKTVEKRFSAVHMPYKIERYGDYVYYRAPADLEIFQKNKPAPSVGKRQPAKYVNKFDCQQCETYSRNCIYRCSTHFVPCSVSVYLSITHSVRFFNISIIK